MSELCHSDTRMPWVKCGDNWGNIYLMVGWFLVYLCCSTRVLLLVFVLQHRPKDFWWSWSRVVSCLVSQEKVSLRGFTKMCPRSLNDPSQTFRWFCCFSNLVLLNWCSPVNANISCTLCIDLVLSFTGLTRSSLGLNMSRLGVILVLVNMVLAIFGYINRWWLWGFFSVCGGGGID